MNLELRGVEVAIAALNTFPDKLEKKVLSKATREGVKVLAAEVKSRVPRDTGLLASSITVRANKRRKGQVGSRVTIKNTEQIATVTKAGKRHFYPAVIEFGSSNRAATPFMRPAYDAKKTAAVEKAKQEIIAGVTREIKSASKWTRLRFAVGV